ncbi:MAG: hypothetical protein H6737_00260 [Alphaproteobacteria bacterium]|nr:hypothetical protein [Alphaproteobacteria bacterium]
MKPWSVVHRGRVAASALLLDPGHLGEEAVRTRILALWAPGCRLESIEGRLLLTFPSPRHVNALELGLPFVREGDALVSAPLRESERTGGGVLEVRGGELGAAQPVPVDASAWLDVELPVAAVRSVGPPAVRAAAAVVAEPLRREAFGVPDPAPGFEHVLDLLRRPEPVAAPPPRAAPSEPGWMAKMLGGLFGRPPTPSGGAMGPLPSAPPVGAGPSEPSEPGLLDGIAAFLARWFPSSGGAVAPERVRSRQEEILASVLERFDGDLEDALRHAIPLGGAGGLGSGMPAMRAPAPRDLLFPSWFASVGSGGGGFGASSSLYDALKAMYLAAAAKLEADGEVEKAAFVLADLLADPSAAVDLLEKHGRYALAAKLAETRLRDWARAVRLHLLARDVSRALRLTHAHGVFAEALGNLADEGSKRALRAAWAALLVKSGRLDAAVGVAWADERLRPATAPWLARIVERGGEQAIGPLLKLAEVAPDEADAAFERLLASAEPEEVAARSELAQQLGFGGPPSWRRRLARRVIADAGRPGVDSTKLQHLLRAPALADLRVDLPVFPSVPVRSRYPQVLGLDESGAVPVHDAVWLPHGVLCALGEAGVALIDRRGETVWADPTPVERFAPDAEGFLVVGIHRVGRPPEGNGVGTVRLSRIDLRSRVVQPWARARLACWADTCVDGRWLVADEVRPMLVDLTAEGWSWLHAGPPMPDPVHSVDAHGSIGVLTDGREPELFGLSPTLESVTLRRTVEIAGQRVLRGGRVLGSTRSGRHVVLASGASQAVFEGQPDDGELVALELLDAYAVVARGTVDGVRVSVLTLSGHPIGHVDALGALRVGLRGEPGRLGIFDDRGRVLWIDPVTGARLRSVRT